MSKMTWAEQIENASEEQQHRMGFGPFLVHLGNLTTTLDLTRTPRSDRVPSPWPVGPAPGWLKRRLDDDWSVTAWCALGGEWVFRAPVPGAKHVLRISGDSSPARRASISQRLHDPFQLVAAGEAFAFCDDLFVIPDNSFHMNSFKFHVPGREPLSLLMGFRGHARQYPEVITPGVYRAHRQPNDQTDRRYKRKARVGANLVKQAVFEMQNVALSNVQARGVLQHYGIIGPTDILDLTYDINIAKWFALNVWDQESARHRPKRFVEHDDHDKAFDEYSVIYMVVVRAIGIEVARELAETLANLGRLTFAPWDGSNFDEQENVQLPPRNLSPLWSTRAKRQSGFGLLGVGPQDDDGWGSVLGIYEHAFHPVFSPNGWDRIGGPSLSLDGNSYRWDDDTSGLSEFALPEDDDCIRWIRANFDELGPRLGL